MKKIIILLALFTLCFNELTFAQIPTLIETSPVAPVQVSNGKSYTFWFTLQNNFQGQTIVAGSFKVSSTDFGVSGYDGGNQNMVVTFLNNNLTAAKTGALTFSAKYMLPGDVTHTYDLTPITVQVTMAANIQPIEAM